jgi:hypothetical protein
MPSITSATITLRGRVNSRVVSLSANGAAVTLAADKTFAHTLTAPDDALVTFTTVASDGVAESRVVRLTRTPQAAPPPLAPVLNA